jgi:hypothetical protein
MLLRPASFLLSAIASVELPDERLMFDAEHFVQDQLGPYHVGDIERFMRCQADHSQQYTFSSTPLTDGAA